MWNRDSEARIKKSRLSVQNGLLILILIFAFAYRLELVNWGMYPPGADIGLHESVINSLTVGHAGLFWNNYHMGGGFSITNPGFHLFAAYIIALTGLPDSVALALIASFFETVIVLCAFLFVQKLWSASAGLVVAFLAAFSGGDIAILTWAGYPNIATLMLVPIVLYLVLQSERFSLRSYLTATSIMVASLFLTHIFSAVIFTGIILFTIIASSILGKQAKLKSRQIICWLLPIALGVVIVLPYIVQAIPVYFNAQGTITGDVPEVKQAILENRIVPLGTVALCGMAAVLFFPLSKLYKGKAITTFSVLGAVWILVPAALTLSFLLGVFVDYERFLYFVYFPAIVCIGLLIKAGADGLSKTIQKIQTQTGPRQIKGHTRLGKGAATVFVFAVLIVLLLYVPIFTGPSAGFEESKYYQVMTPAGYETIQWIKANTSPDAVFVADAQYGWWLSGFAQRPTLSAVNPQELILAREVAPATVAGNFMQAAYFVDNGVIRAAYEGSNSGFQVSVNLGVDGLFPFLLINDYQGSIVYRQDGVLRYLSLAEMGQAKVEVKTGASCGSVVVYRENSEFVVAEEIVVSSQETAQVTLTLQNKTSGVALNWFHLPFKANGVPVQYNNSFAVVDNNMEGTTQITPLDGELGSTVSVEENLNFYDLTYSLNGTPQDQVNFSVGFYRIQTTSSARNETDLQNVIANNIDSHQETKVALSIVTFDYQEAIRDWNISYVAVRDAKISARFMGNAVFDLIYRNGDVCIFKVNDKMLSS